MGSTAFLQKFSKGEEISIPFQPVIDFLSKYGTVSEYDGAYEVVFEPEEIADYADIVGNPEEGLGCIGLERPLIDANFRTFAFEAMQKFGLALFVDDLDTIYLIEGDETDIPGNMLDECEDGVTIISRKEQIWPDGDG